MYRVWFGGREVGCCDVVPVPGAAFVDIVQGEKNGEGFPAITK
jgi:hypothetical protein